MRILIVDDEPIIRQSLAQLITQTDKRCEIVGTAQNGQEALQLLPQLQPDVIFTDIRMPGMSGLELAQHISQSAPEIQIVILSGYAEFEYARSAIDSGVVSYLLKPTKIQELKTVLSKLYGAWQARNQPTLRTQPDEAQSDAPENNAIVRQIIRLVEEHYAEDISLSDIAMKVHLNPTYLSTLFRKETGEKFSVWVTNVRLQHACKLLTDQPYLHVYEVAQQVGYQNAKYFINVFRQQFSMTPSQYREKSSK